VAALSVPAGAAMLLAPALANGFPFLFQDSSDYLVLAPPLYRSPFYGFFIALFHQDRFIWAPVIAQALITSHLLYLLLRVFARPAGEHFALCLFAATLTSLPLFVGYIMPDLFTGLMFVAMYLIAFHFSRFTLPLKLYLAALAVVAIAAHLSHLTMAIAILFLIVPLLRWAGKSWRHIALVTGVLLAPITLTIGAYLTYNAAVFHRVSLSPSGQSFFLANLIEYGPARDYLRKSCPHAGFRLCRYVAQLPATANEMLWRRGPFTRLGGFAGMEDEASDIVRGVLTEEPGRVAAMAARNFVTALGARRPGAELSPAAFPVWDSIYRVVDDKFGPGAIEALLDSAQMRGTVPHALLEAIDAVVAPLSLAGILLLGGLSLRAGRRDLAALALFVICAAFGNVLTCATISGIHDRYQARVSWMLPITDLVLAAALFLPYGVADLPARLRALLQRRGAVETVTPS
jgi:hypothetical protein